MEIESEMDVRRLLCGKKIVAHFFPSRILARALHKGQVYEPFDSCGLITCIRQFRTIVVFRFEPEISLDKVPKPCLPGQWFHLAKLLLVEVMVINLETGYLIKWHTQRTWGCSFTSSFNAFLASWVLAGVFYSPILCPMASIFNFQ